MSVIQTLERQPPWRVVVAALVLVGLIGWLDYVSGWELSLFVFYALPILLVVWKTDQRVGLVFAILCSLIWCAARLQQNPYESALGFGLAGFGRFFYFAIVVVAAGSVKARRELDRKRIETLERAQYLEREILRTSEREQRRIGRDLHDGLGPHLAAMGYAAQLLADELRRRGAPEAAKADQLRAMAGEAVSLSRDLARGIFPVQMEGTGISTALEELAATTSRVTGKSVSYDESGNVDVADPETGMNIYRIAQEAVANALKHGDARSVRIVLTGSGDGLRLAVADDGKGMHSTSDGRRGMGLHSMRYRARALGGHLKIESTPENGTVVSCEIPNRPPASLTPAS